jgi:bacterioferritin (cytochrome b1)
LIVRREGESMPFGKAVMSNSPRLTEALVTERIAIDSCREMVQYPGGRDPATRNRLESSLAVEEEHADELADLLRGRVGEISP